MQLTAFELHLFFVILIFGHLASSIVGVCTALSLSSVLVIELAHVVGDTYSTISTAESVVICSPVLFLAVQNNV